MPILSFAAGLRSLGAAVAACACGLCAAQSISGVRPEVPVLLISESEAQTQMAVQNSDGEPLLLLTQVYEVGDRAGMSVVPVPQVTRVEAGGRQVVRFVLLKSDAAPLTVQHYKRVTFEGIPSRQATHGSRVRVNVRYDLPVIISPRGLLLEDAPWTHLVWSIEGRSLRVENPSRYVVRMSSQVDLLPAVQRVAISRRTFILPGEVLTIELPPGSDPAGVTGVRMFPATLYGYTAPDYDAAIVR